MRRSARHLFMLAGFTACIALPMGIAQEVSLSTVEGFVRIVDMQKKMLDISIKKNGRRWHRIPFHRIKTVYLIPEKSETWPEWGRRVAKRKGLPTALAIYDPETTGENGAGIDYGNLGNLGKFLQPDKSFVRVILKEEGGTK